ncbi:UNVERIFIED_ORG: sugar phosphate permease [Pseudomonas reinekei]|nr:sugar phosphate permease [Pseudomonas reinekei]
MNKHIGTIKRWRVQIFAITWLAYAAFYFTRKAFSVAKLGIAEDPTFMLDKMAMANLDAIYLTAYAVGQFTWGILADRFGPRVVVLGGLLISAGAALVMGNFATLPIFATCMLVQGLAQSTGWSGLCKNLGSFFPSEQRGRVLGPVEFLLRLRRARGLAVCRLVGVYAHRHLACGVCFQCGGGWAGRRAVFYFPTQQT